MGSSFFPSGIGRKCKDLRERQKGEILMRLEANLYQHQTLKLAMTQELTQAIALLQYSAQELTSFLEMKAMENPLIQLESSNVKLMDPHHAYPKNKRPNYSERDQKSWLEQIAEPSKSLQDYLFMQLSMKALTEKQRRLFNQIIYNLDPNGYLTVDLEEISKLCSTSLTEAADCLEMVQQLDPPGVGARNLRECLLLQIERANEAPPLVKTIIQDFFLEFADRKWKQLARKLSIELPEIQQVADYVQTLEPRPGSYYQTEKPHYVVPDLIADIQDGKLSLHLFEKHLPTVHFQKDYFQAMSTYKDKQVKDFLKDKTQDFHWIRRSLEQRKETLIKVGISIINWQQDFFFKGPSYLRPLTMKDISEEIGVHESTVSRTVREKFIQTPFGTFELKTFFSTGLASTTYSDEEQTSAVQVKKTIQELIDNEDKSRPLSDQKIADHLKQLGMEISRRTIAKYRDQLKIPSSSKRKRYD